MLFFTEMWERFSYYGMCGLLKLYMVNYLFVVSRQILQGSQEHCIGDPHAVLGWNFFRHLIDSSPATPPGAYASVIYGWYTGFVYLTPLLGGFLADRYWGQRKTVFLGGALMAAGHFLMAFENWFFFALLLLIIGNGAFKPNISTQVGNLYPPDDPRRDGAFTIFYMGINLGAFICNLVCGTLAATLGWHWGFGAAGVGMMLGLTVYFFGQRFLAADNITATEAIPQAERRQALDASEKRRVWALILLCLLNVVFWAVYEQQGNTMQTWADENTAWPVIMGFQIPSTWFQSFNPLFIFMLAPLLDIFWTWQAETRTRAFERCQDGDRQHHPGPVLHRHGSRRGSRGVRQGILVLAGVLHLARDGRRALSVAHRAISGHKSIPGAHRFADDGHVVPFQLPRQYPVRLHRTAIREGDPIQGRVLLALNGPGRCYRFRDLGLRQAA